MYYKKKAIVRWIKENLGLRTYPHRYDQLFNEIDALHPRTILEIGTNDGINADRLFERASRYRKDVEYYGFDLFELMNDVDFLKEFSLEAPSKEKVDKFLRQNGCLKRQLFAGNTIESLPRNKAQLPKMDLVFIDGGHSEDTVASDWMNVQALLHASSVVFFDDYPNWGVGLVVDAIDRERWDVQIMPIQDVYSVNRRFDLRSNTERMSFSLARVQMRLLDF